jgi:hypothetical protein
MKLFHFTSEFWARDIRDSGELRTSLHPVLGQHLLWLTDDPAPRPTALGFPRRRRMAVRFEVETDAAVSWASIRDDFTDWERGVLENSPGADPNSWWVSRTAIALEAAEAAR